MCWLGLLAVVPGCWASTAAWRASSCESLFSSSYARAPDAQAPCAPALWPLRPCEPSPGVQTPPSPFGSLWPLPSLASLSLPIELPRGGQAFSLSRSCTGEWQNLAIAIPRCRIWRARSPGPLLKHQLSKCLLTMRPDLFLDKPSMLIASRPLEEDTVKCVEASRLQFEMWGTSQLNCTRTHKKFKHQWYMGQRENWIANKWSFQSPLPLAPC